MYADYEEKTMNLVYLKDIKCRWSIINPLPLDDYIFSDDNGHLSCI